jgi:integration host factor subunit alpha
MTLTKLDMVERILETVDMSRKDAKALVDCFFEEIKVALEQGESVKLSGFGNFGLRDKNERPGRNPKTGEDIPVSARRVVTFKSGQKLKAMVETYNGTLPEEDP